MGREMQARLALLLENEGQRPALLGPPPSPLEDYAAKPPPPKERQPGQPRRARNPQYKPLKLMTMFKKLQAVLKVRWI